jgi:hypothetical protein
MDKEDERYVERLKTIEGPGDKKERRGHKKKL